MPLLALLVAACAAGVPAAPEAPMEPTHASVQAAAAAIDAELAAWTATPESYILRPAKRPELTQHQLYFLIPVDASHPISVFLAVKGNEAPFVTTGRPEAAWRVVEAEPTLATSPALPVVVHDLLRDQTRHQQVVEGSGAVSADDTGWTVTFVVDDQASGRERWTVRLAGPASTLSVAKEG